MNDKKTFPFYTAGSVLIWIGVLAWFPFFALRFAGEKPSVLLFLPFHLVGVVGGARLRAYARRQDGFIETGRPWHRKLGHGLIIVGVFMWTPYFVLKYGLGLPAEVATFLPYHLTGVLSGIGFLIYGKIIETLKEKQLTAEKNIQETA